MQTPAYSHDEVFAAVMALTAAGETPTRANLFNKLGRRGQSLTAWKTYQEMIAAGLLDLPRQVMEEDSSPELAKAEQAHKDALRTLTEVVRAQTAKPYQVRLQAMEKSLIEHTTTVADLEAVIGVLEQHIEQLEADLTRLRKGNGQRLIL